MSTAEDLPDLAPLIEENLPFLRRYARALTGSQTSGDRYAMTTLEALLADRSLFEGGMRPRVALYRAFHVIWTSSGSPINAADTDLERRAQGHLAGLTPNTREALLLTTIEEMGLDEVAQIMDVTPTEAASLVAIARQQMQTSITGQILIIEDEAIIAMDIKAIVTSMGHSVTGVARTRSSAIEKARETRPDLILADIHLADDSSGIDAVNEILEECGAIPVIFITAYPERLLTGERPEPAFLIAKPYREDQVFSAVSQAMFFASTDTLTS